MVACSVGLTAYCCELIKLSRLWTYKYHQVGSEMWLPDTTIYDVSITYYLLIGSSIWNNAGTGCFLCCVWNGTNMWSFSSDLVLIEHIIGGGRAIYMNETVLLRHCCKLHAILLREIRCLPGKLVVVICWVYLHLCRLPVKDNSISWYTCS